MDNYRIDSHKLIYHPERITDWLKGINICPIYIEISPAGSCNHRCVYCALDFMEYKPVFLKRDVLKERLREMGKGGVKGIMYAGEGEPLLHKDIVKIINDTRQAGIDVALTTNGVLFNEDIAKNTLAHLSWVKVSINAANPENYSVIHRTHHSDFKRVVRNMSYAAKLRKDKGYKCTLGMQIVLLPENMDDVLPLAQKAKTIGMDYLVVKPYSQHPLSRTTRYKSIKYGEYLGLSEKLHKVNSRNFNVVFRVNTMKKWDSGKRSYKHCLALPFWAYIDSSGDVWACSIYLTRNKFCLGNIYKHKFKDICESKKRHKLVLWAAQRLDTYKCRINCRMDEINRFLWELKYPIEHVNFI